MLYALKGHNAVTIDIYTDWNKAFAASQELGRRVGFGNVSIHSYKDSRTPDQKAGRG